MSIVIRSMGASTRTALKEHDAFFPRLAPGDQYVNC